MRTVCERCLSPFTASPRGRRARFCSTRCRVAAHRAPQLPPRPLRVLVGCEHTGAVRDAFTALGHEAMSCDLLPDESGTDGWHYQGDVRDTIGEGWDLAVMHPPCTYLANAGVSWLHHDAERWSHLIDAASFFRWCLELPIPKVAVENPVMHGYGKRMVGAEPTQIVHPWQHGHAAQKATGLWLRGLPKLTPTDVVANARTWVETVPDIKDRWKIRSATYPGIAMAMAEQWGGVTVKKKKP